MASKKRSVGAESRSPSVAIDIAGVTASTRLGDLTIRQFVDLVLQLEAQLPPRTAAHDDRTIDRVLQHVRRAVEQNSGNVGRPIDHAIKVAQKAIFDEMPNAMKQAVALQSSRPARRRS